MQSWIVDKIKLRRAIVERHEYQPSIRRLFKEAGIENRYHGGEKWSHEVMMTICAHLGIDPGQIGRRGLSQGRPPREYARLCPKVVRLPDDVRALVSRAVAREGELGAGEWVMNALRRAAE